jgi:isopentenyl diphosphate isomerase/L-lactate dehydrogenase-like FMN-dependent dehydrogenase
VTAEKVAAERPQTLTELFTLARENLKEKGQDRQMPSGSNYLASSEANRRLLDSVFMEPKFLDPVQPDTSLTLFGARMKTPAFCSALSKPGQFTDEEMADLVRGMGNAGSMMMLGIGGSEMLQLAIDTGAPVVKMVKPYRETELIYTKVKDAESRGCVAVGIDIDHFYGTYRDGRSTMADTFSPKQMDEIRQAISLTKLPFMLKGVLSLADAQKAIDLGASAIAVSNHGAGSFDFGVPAIVALPTLAEAVGDKLTILVDTGFRTGNDMFKALAFGAQGVGFATQILLAASAGGAIGVEEFIGFVTGELKRTMAITGCADLSAIDRSLLIASPEVRKWW